MTGLHEVHPLTHQFYVASVNLFQAPSDHYFIVWVVDSCNWDLWRVQVFRHRDRQTVTKHLTWPIRAAFEVYNLRNLSQESRTVLSGLHNQGAFFCDCFLRCEIVFLVDCCLCDYFLGERQSSHWKRQWSALVVVSATRVIETSTFRDFFASSECRFWNIESSGLTCNRLLLWTLWLALERIVFVNQVMSLRCTFIVEIFDIVSLLPH